MHHMVYDTGRANDSGLISPACGRGYQLSVNIETPAGLVRWSASHASGSDVSLGRRA